MDDDAPRRQSLERTTQDRTLVEDIERELHDLDREAGGEGLGFSRIVDRHADPCSKPIPPVALELGPQRHAASPVEIADIVN